MNSVKNEPIKNNQYGLRSKSSVTDSIASITEFVRSEIDNKATGLTSFSTTALFSNCISVNC